MVQWKMGDFPFVSFQLGVTFHIFMIMGEKGTLQRNSPYLWGKKVSQVGDYCPQQQTTPLNLAGPNPRMTQRIGIQASSRSEIGFLLLFGLVRRFLLSLLPLAIS